jgi:hypothetical protein
LRAYWLGARIHKCGLFERVYTGEYKKRAEKGQTFRNASKAGSEHVQAADAYSPAYDTSDACAVGYKQGGNRAVRIAMVISLLVFVFLGRSGDEVPFKRVFGIKSKKIIIQTGRQGVA